ncbi:MAG: PaaI family thioesterase [Polyangiales bacterium]
MQPILTADEVTRVIAAGFHPAPVRGVVEEVRPGFVRTRTPLDPVHMLRPGGVISGPALFTAADLAMYAVVLAHVGPQLMAVTSDLSIRFLRKGTPADIVAEASLLKLGRRLAIIDVRLSCGDDPALVAHATGTYALP